MKLTWFKNKIVFGKTEKKKKKKKKNWKYTKNVISATSKSACGNSDT